MFELNKAYLKKLMMAPAVILAVSAFSFYPSNQQTVSAQSNQQHRSARLFNVREGDARDAQMLNKGRKRSIAAVRERSIEIAVTADELAASKQLEFPLLDGFDFAVERNEREGFERRGESDVTWRGRIVGDPNSSVTLTLKDGALSGSIFTTTGAYEIVAQEGGQQQLVEINHGLFPKCGVKEPAQKNQQRNKVNGNDYPFDAEVQSIESHNDNPLSALVNAPIEATAAATTTTTTTGPVIDVMVVYSDDARAAAGSAANIQSMIQQAVDQTNTAYLNSAINQRVRLVHTAEINYDESGVSSTDLKWIANNTTVKDLRNQYKADLVSFVVNHMQDACGVANLLPSVSSRNDSYGYSVIMRQCTLNGYTFAHELGHNMGAMHNPENSSANSGSSFKFAYGHYVNGVFRTIMSYSDPCTTYCSVIPYFSNPNITYNGYPTGIVDQRDNARLHNITAATVAAHRGAPIGRTIGMQSVANRYVYVKGESTAPHLLKANGSGGSTFEKFVVVDAGNGEVALKCLANNKYVTAETYSNNQLSMGGRPGIGNWQRFRWIDRGDGKFALQAITNNKYVTVDTAVGSQLFATKTTIGNAETFASLLY